MSLSPLTSSLHREADRLGYERRVRAQRTPSCQPSRASALTPRGRQTPCYQNLPLCRRQMRRATSPEHDSSPRTSYLVAQLTTPHTSRRAPNLCLVSATPLCPAVTRSRACKSFRPSSYVLTGPQVLYAQQLHESGGEGVGEYEVAREIKNKLSHSPSITYLMDFHLVPPNSFRIRSYVIKGGSGVYP
jgi:hypothetical protein